MAIVFKTSWKKPHYSSFIQLPPQQSSSRSSSPSLSSSLRPNDEHCHLYNKGGMTTTRVCVCECSYMALNTSSSSHLWNVQTLFVFPPPLLIACSLHFCTKRTPVSTAGTSTRNLRRYQAVDTLASQGLEAEQNCSLNFLPVLAAGSRQRPRCPTKCFLVVKVPGSMC